MGFDFNSAKPLIIYPCHWTYAVLGQDEAAMRAELATVIGALQHTVGFSKQSGKFSSLHVKVLVESETHRNEIFQKIQQLSSVRHII